jgi:hypothetical protein
MSCVTLLLAQAAENQEVLTVAGAMIMTVSVVLVLGLNVFCFWRILRESEPAEHLHAPLEIEIPEDVAEPVRCPEPGCRMLNEPGAEYCARCGAPLGEKGDRSGSG